MEITIADRKVKLKGTALPAEHGGWGFLVEPLVLGLLVAGSIAGLGLVMLAFGAFLLRQPLKVALIDHRRGKRYARTMLAERFALVYGVMALLGLLLALGAGGLTILLPLLAALPLGLVQLVYDARGDSRSLFPELAGASAMGSTAAALALAGGWSLVAALALWAVQVARVIPSILYVRARLPLEKGKAAATWPALLAHLLGILALGALWLAGLAPALALAGGLLLLLRASKGLSRWRRPSRAPTIGILEMVYGLAFAVLAAVGYVAGI